MSDLHLPQLSSEQYTVAWICALPVPELVAARRMLDERHRVPSNMLLSTDDNKYHCGSINGHNVVIACLPEKLTGNLSSAELIDSLCRSFPNTKVNLLVGLGGGVPNPALYKAPSEDIHLGDVVVGWTDGEADAVVQWDSGRKYPDGRYQIVGRLPQPDRKLGKALGSLKADHWEGESKIYEHLKRCTDDEKRFPYPGLQEDILFDASYAHNGPDRSPCDKCDLERTVIRAKREETKFEFHFGTIASGSSVMKDGVSRDKISHDCYNARCFEMEAAGVMNRKNCLVIRGIADYSDSHKNKSWQPYAAATAAAFARELLYTIDPVAVDTITSSVTSAKTSISTVPKYLSRTDDFLGRNTILHQLEERLKESSRVSLVGLGGIGKTRIAVEYAQKIFRRDHPEGHILWVYAATADSFDASYNEIAEAFQIPGRDQDGFIARTAVPKWLDEEFIGPWLMILDNMDDSSLAVPKSNPTQAEKIKYISYCLPYGTEGPRRMIITSRFRELGRDLAFGDEPIKIESLSPLDSKLLLSAKIKDRRKWDEQAAEDLMKVLDFTPLAITQAAAYITKFDRSSVTHYLKLLEGDDNSIVGVLSKELQDYTRGFGNPSAIFRTWRLSYELIHRERPKAADLLSLMSILANQEIPEFLLAEGETFTTEEEDDMQSLVDLSLVKSASDGKTYGMHRLVRLSTQDWLRSVPATIEKWKSLGVTLVQIRFPAPRKVHNSRKLCRKLLPHAQIVSQYNSGDQSSVSSILYKMGFYESDQAMYDDAYLHASKSFEIRQRLYGDVSKETLEAKWLMAHIHKLRGAIAQARQMFEEILRDQESLYDKDDDAMLITLSVIVQIQEAEGNYREAEAHWRRNVRIRESMLGEEALETLDALHNLAYNLKLQNKFEEAENIFRRVVAIKAKLEGPDSVDALSTVNMLATVLVSRGKLYEAEELQQRVVAGREEEFGRLHPLTLTALATQAWTFSMHRKFEQAEELGREVMEARKIVSGLDHEETLAAFYNYAYTLYDQKKYEEALPPMQEAAHGFMKMLGPKHPHTKQCLQYLEAIKVDYASSQQRASG